MKDQQPVLLQKDLLYIPDSLTKLRELQKYAQTCVNFGRKAVVPAAVTLTVLSGIAIEVGRVNLDEKITAETESITLPNSGNASALLLRNEQGIKFLYEELLDGTSVYDADLSPNHQSIAFTSNYGTTHNSIFILEEYTDPSSWRIIAKNDPNASENLPKWSPDGKYLLFTSRGADNKDQLVRVKADGTERTNLTPMYDVISGYAWSPDGKAIVFAALFSIPDLTPFNYLLFSLNPNESALTPILSTENSGFAVVNSWSSDNRIEVVTDYGKYQFAPDGSQIVEVERFGVESSIFKRIGPRIQTGENN